MSDLIVAGVAILACFWFAFLIGYDKGVRDTTHLWLDRKDEQERSND